MSESKSNAARHGLKVGDMVGILAPAEPCDFGLYGPIGRIGCIKALGNGRWDGFCAVFVNGKHWWLPESILCKISRRGCFRRIKPRRRTAPASGCKEYTAGELASVAETPLQAKAENWRVMFPDGQNVKIEDVCAGTSFSAPPSGEYEVTVGAGAGSEPQPEAPKAEPKFKAGDRVICEGLPGGVSGKVMYVGWRGDKIFVLSDDENSYSWLPASLYRHASAEPSPATEPAPEPEKPKFKPFDRVLVRDMQDGTWYPALYAFCDRSMDYPHITVGGPSWKYCIPYEGNEALAGTTNDPEKG